MGLILRKRIKVQGFIIFDDYSDRYGEFAQDMQQWLNDGKIKYKEHLETDFEKTLDAFNAMLNGENFGKTVVQVQQPI